MMASTDNHERGLAIALQYHDLVPAPIILARGAGWQADLIRRQALAAGIPVVKDPGLLEELALVRLGDVIPESCYRVVAALYRFVYECQPDKLRNAHEELSGQ